MENKDKPNFFYALSLVFQLGFIIAIPLVGFLAIGIFLDKTINSSPLFLLIFIVFSFIFIFFELRYYLHPFLKK